MSTDCDCGTCCDRHGHDDDCMSSDITDDITGHDHDICLYGPSETPSYDHDAYTL